MHAAMQSEITQDEAAAEAAALIAELVKVVDIFEKST